MTFFMLCFQACKTCHINLLYVSPHLTSLVALSLPGLVLYFLLEAGLTIVHILAVSVFTALLFVVGLTPYASYILKWFERKRPRSDSGRPVVIYLRMAHTARVGRV
jgi:cell division protein FtsW (lipid II flippase)